MQRAILRLLIRCMRTSNKINLVSPHPKGFRRSGVVFFSDNKTRTLEGQKGVVDAGVCITQESDSKLLAIIRAAHALLAAGDAEAARDLLASFSSPGVDALC